MYQRRRWRSGHSSRAWPGRVCAVCRGRRACNGAVWLLLAILGVALPPVGATQSLDLLQTAQRFEEARLAGDYAGAVRLGNEALALLEANPEHSASGHDAIGQDTIELADLLVHLGEAQAQLGQHQAAVRSYERALALRETELGVEHPDLVPMLSALANLQLAQQRYPDAEAQLQRILTIERAAYGERHPNAITTLRKLHSLYVSAGRTADAASTEASITTLTTSERSVPLTRSKPKRDRRYKQEQGAATVRVFYGTNRAPTGEPKPAEFYGTERGELEVGYLDVSIPEIHQEGELETRSRWFMFSYEIDPSARRRYVLLNKVTPLSSGSFVKALQGHIKASPSPDVFVFVHGFNSSFEDAARRTAQLAYDLDFDGTPVLYSWPSQGSTTAYTVDEAAVGISSRKLAGFLATLVDHSGAQRIHLIAHSMGNRALIESLETYLAKRAPAERKQVFGQIVFTAPDVDRDYFFETIAALRESAARVTLYASDNDLALKTSQKIHGAPRAGLAGAGIILLPWLDTIDMSAVQADMLGHNYYAADAGAIYDLFRMLWRDDSPAQRCGMVDRLQSDLHVWRFNVDVCQGHDLLQAGVLFKRFGSRAKARVRARMNALSDSAEKQQWSRILARLDALLETQ